MADGVEKQRLKIAVSGAVQGVGFRPFIYRLATGLGLTGWVNNSSRGVLIEAEGPAAKLREFLLRIENEKPPLSFIQSLESSFLDPVGFTQFEIGESDAGGGGAKTALILPDIATCGECLREVFDPDNRRHLYPFTNCTHCGPRFTIIEKLPYDRPSTTMKIFKMCAACEEEYGDPRDRRFHAQPNACPACGPQLALWDSRGAILAARHAALLAAAQAIREGKIVAVKGIGGFHLMADARNGDAVARLREKKHREEKPFALMFPSLEKVREVCEASALEERLLASPEAPIVLLRRKPFYAGDAVRVASPVAPGNPYLGILLPHSPLHHILMRELGFPVVATSGNAAEEPICTDENEAVERLGGIADLFLAHNRPIARHTDDSIARVVLDREMILRRSRGYAPLPVHTAHPLPALLSVGAHLKNTVAAAHGSEIFLSQHIGDLETAPTFAAFERATELFQQLYGIRPEAAACDLHPDYLSTQFARKHFPRAVGVQHHYAHILSCMAENQLEGPALGVAWDGTGYGPDGTVWGGEFLKITDDNFERFAHLRTFPLPGSQLAVKEPRRSALGLLHEIFGAAVFEMADLPTLRSFSAQELNLLKTVLEKGVNTPRTSSAGRLFDAFASLCGLRQRARHEGQAAMELEFLLEGTKTEEAYPFDLAGGNIFGQNSPIIIDWKQSVLAAIKDVRRGERAQIISAKFHNALVEWIVAVAHRAREERVVLSGGCFQNKVLTEKTVARLKREGFRPAWHQRIPPNDGGIALGQIVAAARAARRKNETCV